MSGDRGPSSRRFTSGRQSLTALTAVAHDAPPLFRAYTGGLSPTLREAVMLAVSNANECDRCVQVHEKWASRVRWRR